MYIGIHMFERQPTIISRRMWLSKSVSHFRGHYTQGFSKGGAKQGLKLFTWINLFDLPWM